MVADQLPSLLTCSLSHCCATFGDGGANRNDPALSRIDYYRIGYGCLPGGVPIFLAVTIVAFAILDRVLGGIPAIVLFGPLLFPSQVGVHDVHYAMVVILAMGIGLFAPPFGGYYAACAISRINPDDGMKPIIGYMVALLIGTLIVAAVPWISTGFL